MDNVASTALAEALRCNSTLQRFDYVTTPSIDNSYEDLAILIEAVSTNTVLKSVHFCRYLDITTFRAATLRNRMLPMLACHLIEIFTKCAVPVVNRTMCCPGVCASVFSF